MTLDREFLVGKRVTVLGLGIEGTDLVRYLASHGAVVTVSDTKSPEALSARIRQIEDLPVQFSLGEHRIEDIASADMVFVSQGIPQTLPALEEARTRGVAVSSMTKLFLELCPAPVIGITGSSGKTTTTALVDAMFRAAGRKHVVGGNIGVGLLGLIEDITSDMWVVLEMSHTQLETAERSPHIACVTNVTPNHLDRYSWDEYVALKLNVIKYQSKDDFAILNLEDEVASTFSTEAPGHVAWFSSRRAPSGSGSFVREGSIFWRQGSVETRVLGLDEIPLRGAHNVENVLAAVAVAGVVGLDFSAVAQAVRTFETVPHRLEWVAEIDGASYYNDSIATTPERTVAGLRSFSEPIVLLLGGREKNLPLEDFAQEVVERCRTVICFGEAGPLLEEALRYAAAGTEEPEITLVDTMANAVEVAAGRARAGDVVLLSPACASYDAYDNFEQRGDEFRRIVQDMSAKGGTEPSRSHSRAGQR